MNALIARGLQPIGADLPQVGALLNDKRNQEFRNALATQQMGIQQQNALSYQRSLDEQSAYRQYERETAEQNRGLAIFQNAYNYARQNPNAIPAVVRDLKGKGLLSAQFPDAPTPEELDTYAAKEGLQVYQAPAPFEQTDEARKLKMQHENAIALERFKRQNPSGGGSYRTLSADEAKALGLPPGGVWQQGPDGQISAVSKPDNRTGGGLPVGALKITDEAQQAINASSESLALVDRALEVIGSGRVSLGLWSNSVAKGRNAVGKSSDASRAYADVQQTFEKLRNNYLLLAKGVQTEGDAQRAWNSEIGAGAENDNKLATQQLQKARGMIERMVNLQQNRIDSIYANYGSTPPEQTQPRQQGATGGWGDNAPSLDDLLKKYGGP